MGGWVTTLALPGIGLATNTATSNAAWRNTIWTDRLPRITCLAPVCILATLCSPA